MCLESCAKKKKASKTTTKENIDMNVQWMQFPNLLV